MSPRHDIELMQHADGELGERERTDLQARLEREPEARTKLEALGQVSELVRGHLELAADDVPERRFEAMWRAVDHATRVEAEVPAGLWARITSWLDRHRGHLITGAVSAGAVAAIALVLRPGDPDRRTPATRGGAIDVQPASLRQAPEIESLDTPDGEGTVLNIQDEDGNTTVIWVSPADTVEGI